MQTETLPASVPYDARIHERIPLEARITMSSQSNFWTGFTQDISEGGVFVLAVAPPEVGEMLPVHIQTEDGRAMLVWGEVRWHREEEDGTPIGCGIRFHNVDERAREVLNEMMAAAGREPLLMEV